MKEIRITDEHNRNKVHAFRFDKGRHVRYNQIIGGHSYYRLWRRVKMDFGYSEYLQQAKKLRPVSY
jgi:hypothetical protein